MTNIIIPVAPFERNLTWEASNRNHPKPERDQEDIWSFRPDFGLGLGGQIVDAAFSALLPSVGNRGRRGQHQAFMSALLALAQAATDLRNENGRCGFLHERSTSRNKKVPERYEKCDFNKAQFMKALDALTSWGFVTYYKGFKHQDAKQGVSSFWMPEPPFRQWLDEHLADLELVSFREAVEVIRLKDSKKRLCDYVDDEMVIAMRERVEASNRMRSDFAWSYIPMSDERQYQEGDQRRFIPRTSLRCHRQFRENFQSGGRFYCAAQSLRKGERATITVNGEPTIELDYKSLHPRLLYNDEGIEAPADCYASDARPRELTKMVSLLSLNCKSLNQARQTLMQREGLSSDVASEHLRRYAEEHPGIAHRFFNSGWRRLQFLDSQIVDAVLTKATAKGIPVLPVHDSFIVATRYADWLKQAAADGYQELTGFTSVIDWEPMPDVEMLFADRDY
ncbi:hypothetical protein [Marinobacter sp.]|uniref:hypothetical protein n=1 Tax=Marinobacter sp. TaxID=50741 RepID=UPI0023568892|nr:hypothetical protein [Marinobacter sp.]